MFREQVEIWLLQFLKNFYFLDNVWDNNIEIKRLVILYIGVFLVFLYDENLGVQLVDVLGISLFGDLEDLILELIVLKGQFNCFVFSC